MKQKSENSNWIIGTVFLVIRSGKYLGFLIILITAQSINQNQNVNLY